MMRKILAAAVVVAAASTALAQAASPASRLLGRRPSQNAGQAQAPAAGAAARPAAGAARPTAADPGEVTMSGETSVMNMDGAALELVLKIYGELVKKTIIVDPAVQGTLNNTIKFKSAPGQSLTEEERIFAYETILEMNQIHLEPYGESFIRALPRKDVRKEGIPLIIDPDAKLGESGRVVSMMINFKNIATDEAQKVLEGLKSNSGLLLVFERTNSILVTDTEQNINRMLEIAKMIDVATPVTENVFTIQIQYASANDIKTALEAIVQESQKELEKNGKQIPAAAQQPSPPSRISLLPKIQSQRQQPAASVNNESLFMGVSDADRGMIRGKVLILADERSNKLIIVTSQSNMNFFEKVIKDLDVETTPDTVVKVYRLKYAECEDVSDMINDLIGNAPSSKSSGKSNQNQNAKQGTSSNLTRNSPATAQKKPANQRTGEAKTGELSKENTTVLADKRINGIVVMTNKELVPVIEQIIERMDVKLSQVLIETCIVEVTLGDDLQTGIDWVNNRWNGKDPLVSGGGGGGSGSSTLSQLVQTKSYSDWIKEARDAYGLGASDTISDAQVQSYIKAAETYGASATPIGAGVTYLLKSDKLNISAVIHASKSDAHAKYLASPIVMTVDNKEATIEATEARKFFNGYETSNSYSTYVRTPKYDSKDIGITIKVTPKINPNGTVMLTVEEEYSQLGAGQSILVDNGDTQLVDTSLTRKMSADVLLDNRQTVILGGLTQTRESAGTTGIPILKDIPWVGKWLFGSVTQTESRNELLVFLTPYVLDDSQSAQAEAARRKSVLSDATPWDDHGWSASKLADPVSKKELLRRIKEEAAKQDEEREARRAIEQWKLERAKKLGEMSRAERDTGPELQKEELDGGRSETPEKREQSAEVRRQKLAEAMETSFPKPGPRPAEESKEEKAK